MTHQEHMHLALRTEVIGSAAAQSTNHSLVRLQQGRDRVAYSLHARPTGSSSFGIQATDFLAHLGLRRSTCAFQPPECYVKQVAEDFEVMRCATEFARSWAALQDVLWGGGSGGGEEHGVIGAT